MAHALLVADGSTQAPDGRRPAGRTVPPGAGRDGGSGARASPGRRSRSRLLAGRGAVPVGGPGNPARRGASGQRAATAGSRGSVIKDLPIGPGGAGLSSPATANRH